MHRHAGAPQENKYHVRPLSTTGGFGSLDNIPSPPPLRRWGDGRNLRNAPPFDPVGEPEGLDDTVALSTTEEGVEKLAQLLLFNLVGRPEGLDDTVVLSITQEDSFG